MTDRQREPIFLVSNGKLALWAVLILLAMGPASCVPGTIRAALGAMLPETDTATPPFRAMQGQQPNYQHRVAFSKFPDWQSCLVIDERWTDNPDKRRFDWGAMSSDDEVEVCLFRVFRPSAAPVG